MKLSEDAELALRWMAQGSRMCWRSNGDLGVGIHIIHWLTKDELLKQGFIYCDERGQYAITPAGREALGDE